MSKRFDEHSELIVPELIPADDRSVAPTPEAGHTSQQLSALLIIGNRI